MADERKRRKRSKGSTSATGRATEKKSKRYTPPAPPEYKASSRVVTILTFVFFGIGVLIILLNYLPGAPLIPGDTNNRNLLIGLAFICLGFGTSTRLR